MRPTCEAICNFVLQHIECSVWGPQLSILRRYGHIACILAICRAPLEEVLGILTVRSGVMLTSILPTHLNRYIHSIV
jgi:hypothetical protein